MNFNSSQKNYFISFATFFPLNYSGFCTHTHTHTHTHLYTTIHLNNILSHRLYKLICIVFVSSQQFMYGVPLLSYHVKDWSILETKIFLYLLHIMCYLKSDSQSLRACSLTKTDNLLFCLAISLLRVIALV